MAHLGASNAALWHWPSPTGHHGSLQGAWDTLARPSARSPTPIISPGTLVSTETTTGYGPEEHRSKMDRWWGRLIVLALVGLIEVSSPRGTPSSGCLGGSELLSLALRGSC